LSHSDLHSWFKALWFRRLVLGIRRFPALRVSFWNLAKPLTLSLLLGCIIPMLLVQSAGAAGPKRVLILYSFGRGFSPFGAVASDFQTDLAEEFKGPIQFHEVPLEGPLFEANESEEPVVGYLQALFTGRAPDLVVPCGGPAVRFALRQRARLFPSTPLVLAGVEARHLNGIRLDTNTTAVTASIDLPSVFENIMQLWPATTNIAVVLGSSSLERFWRTETEREFERFTNHVTFTWLDQLTLADMGARVAHLPRHSVIFYMSVFVDAGSVPYENDRALTTLYSVANAPIVSLFDHQLGLGIVGGRLLSVARQSRETAQAAARILNGESPAAIHIPPLRPDKPVYDWRELKRWGIPESKLPLGNEVRFRAPAFIELYRWRILGVASICVLEAALIITLVRELRRRRRTERSLRESQERMNLATGAAELGIWEWDLLTDHIWATGPTASRLHSNESSQSDYSRFLHSVHPGDRDAVTQAVARATNGGGDYQSVHRAVMPGGQIRWIAARGRVEFDGKHKPLRMRGVSLDITARKEAEDRAQESERRFLLLANCAPVLIWASGPDKLCNFFNEPWLQFTGRRLEQEVGNGWTEGVHPDDLPGCLKGYSEAFDARSPFILEYRLRRHDGQYRWVSDHGVPRYDTQKNFLGYIGSCVDITERKQAEADLQETRRELAHVGRVSTLGELAGSLAHELNQPLTAILSNTQAAQRYLNTDPVNLKEVREILKDVVAEDRRAGEVIIRMRAMLKKGEVQMAPQDLNDLIGEVVTLMRSELVVRNVLLEMKLTPDLPPVRGDRIQLQQVLLNLIINACEAMSANSAAERRLAIHTEATGATQVQVTVSDRGPGLASKALECMYQPFCTTKPNGLGMGLAICRSIITAHGGQLWVTNNPDRGATARFTLEVHRNGSA
jgi:PAS domain S-box-containing protein